MTAFDHKYNAEADEQLQADFVHQTLGTTNSEAYDIGGTSGRGSRGRIVSFDVIRLIAISCVVLCHSVETVYKTDHLSLGYGVTHYLGRLGVPLFLFLTGALLINKEFDSGSIKRFFSHNWLGLVITSEVWILVYWVYGSLHGDAFDFGLLARYATFQEKLPHGFWWYSPSSRRRSRGARRGTFSCPSRFV